MPTETHRTAPNQYVKTDSSTFAYRHFGTLTDGVPLVFLGQFTSTMDDWDPSVVDAFAADREVIVFDNAGIGNSTGTVPSNFESMAADVAGFFDALGLDQVDLVGFSMGGIISQLIALDRPELVRKMILLGNGPRGGVGMEAFNPKAAAIFAAEYEDPDLLWLPLFFTESAESQAAGRAFVERIKLRVEDRSPRIRSEGAAAQLEAIREWGIQKEGSYEYLKNITQPTLVLNGDDDIVVDSINSWILQQNIPQAQLIILPDSGHGAWAQYPGLFHQYVTVFLNG